MKLIEETKGYVTAENKLNTDAQYLVAGSKNVLIDRQRKVVIRRGISRLGAGSVNENPIKNKVKWTSSTGQKWMLRNYDDELEVWIGTLDGVDEDTWHRIANGWDTDEVIRFAPIWKDSETLDVVLFVQGDDNLYEWGGGVAIVDSVAGGNTITKKGTTTWGQNRFYASANLTLVNTRNGNEHTYTGGTGTTTLTGVNNTTDILAGDVLAQKVVTHANEPVADRNNHTIGVFENHALIGSNDDAEVYMTANNDFTDTTFSAPRIAGEGGLFTLDGQSRGFGKLGSTLILFAGDDGLFRVLFKEIAVSTTLAEVLDVKKLVIGANQGSYGADTIAQLGNAIIYLSKEPALRYLQDPEQLEGTSPQTLSNPIKPDFDAEDWTNAHILWFRNAVYLTSPVNSRLYILEFVEDADGKLRRFWQPPQTLAARSLAELDGKLYAGSNVVEETYELFASGVYSDMIANGAVGSPDDKIAIPAVAAFSYNTYGRRAELKNFDEYFVEGEIRQNSKPKLTLYYEFGGIVNVLEKTINGDDSDILEENLLNASLGQQSLGQYPLGGVLESPDDASYFSVIFEIAKEDFRKIQAVFSSDELDSYWSIISHGANIKMSPRKDTIIKK